MFNSKITDIWFLEHLFLIYEINLDRTGSGCIRFNDWKVDEATFAP